MDTRQRRTYLVYSRGLKPEDLTLGSLYSDPANPLDGERKRFECPSSLADIQDWIGQPQVDEPCSLIFTASCEWLLGAGFLDVVGGRAGQTRSEEVAVTGASSRRFQIRKPETFLNEIILASPEAKKWLRQQLSISRAMYFSRKLRLGSARHPRIWMVTGIQYITGGEVVNTRNQSDQAVLSVTTPTPEPIAAAVSVFTGQLGPKIEGSVKSNSATSTTYHHMDERVWAAQFTPLKVHFCPAGEVDETKPLGRILLRQSQDLGSSGVRIGNPLDTEAHVEVADVVGLDEGNAEEWDENPESLLHEMEDVDWALLDSYWESITHNSDD